MEAVAHLLRLLVQQLLGHVFPGEAQVTRHGHEPQPDGPTLRQVQRSGIAVAVVIAQRLGDGVVGQIGRRDDVRDRRAGESAHAATLGQMRLDERAVLAVQLAEGVQGLDHAGALRPAAPDAAGQSHDGHFAAAQRLPASRECVGIRLDGRVDRIAGPHVRDPRRHRQPVLRQADAPCAQVMPDLFVLRTVEAVASQQRVQPRAALTHADALRQHGVEYGLHHRGEFRPRPAGVAEQVEFLAPHRGQFVLPLPEEVRHHQSVIVPGQQGIRAARQAGVRTPLVDGKVVDYRLHGKRQRVLQARLGR